MLLSKLIYQINSTSQLQSSSSSPKDVRQKDKIMAACVGGILTSLTMTPLDVIKTRLQTQLTHSTSPLTSTFNHPLKPTLSINSGLLSTTKRSVYHLQKSQTCSKQLPLLSNETISQRFDPRALNHSCASLSLSFNPSSSSSSTNLSNSLKHVSSSWITSTSSSKSLIQSVHPSTVPPSGIIDSIFKIVKHEGLGTLWRGIGPTLVMAIPAQAVYMVGYDTLRSNLIELSFKSTLDDTQAITSHHQLYRTTMAPLIAGSLSRSFVAILFCPLELLRTRLQSAPINPIKPLTQFNHNQTISKLGLNQSNSILKSTISSVKQLGISSLYRGLSATLWRDVPFSGIYWSTYEICRKIISNGNGFGESIPSNENQIQNESLTVKKITIQSFLAGSISGCFAAILTNPFDLIKTRRQVISSNQTYYELQNQINLGTLSMIYQIGKYEGIKGLMKGLSPRLAKIIPSCGIMIASYEGLAQVFAQY